LLYAATSTTLYVIIMVRFTVVCILATALPLVVTRLLALPIDGAPNRPWRYRQSGRANGCTEEIHILDLVIVEADPVFLVLLIVGLNSRPPVFRLVRLLTEVITTT